MEEAGRLLPSYPDSAWLALQQIHFPEQLSGREKADYWFFHAMARRNMNQSYIRDSSLTQAIHFYHTNHDSSRLQETYRLEAQRQEWLGQHAMADSLYRQAINYYPYGEIKPWALYDKLIMLHGNHINPKNYPLARTYARQLIAISATSTWKAHAYYQLAANYNFEGIYPDSTVYYTHKCLEEVRQLPLEEQAFYLSNCANMIGLAPHTALSLCQEASRIQPRSECSNTCTQGYIYLAMARPDSALLCYQRAMELYKKQYVDEEKEYPTLHNSLITLYACAAYAIQPRDIRVKDFIYNDSIEIASKRLRLINEENAEIQQTLWEKQIYLKLQQQRMRSAWIISLALCILLLLIAYIYFRRRKQQWIAAEEKIEALELILAKANTAGEPASDGAFFRHILLKQLGLIRLIASTPTVANQDLLRQFNKIGQQADTPDHLLIWEELYPVIDSSYHGFHASLVNQYADRLNEKEIQLCCLLRAGFTTKEIHVVTGQSVSTIYHRKIDIRQKLNLEETGRLFDFLSHLG